ncbi:unnamed protein product [Acanthoscelides obtectus]|uniref:Homeobox domain-containing protein n=1 Tax=Acanthoscelides obtectus TaxID=200917 RepID=A0A9P0LTR0_ACAOB
MICHDVDQIAKSDAQRRYFKDMIVAGLSIENTSDFDDFVCNVYIPLGTQYHNHLVQQSKTFFQATANKPQSDNVRKFIHIQNDIEIDWHVSSDTLYSSSPFYKRYLNLIKKITSTSSKTEKKYFNQDMLQVAAKKNLYPKINRNTYLHRILKHNASKSKRVRTAYTPYQLQLEKQFDTNTYLSRPSRIQVAEELDLVERQIKALFQNRRMKYKIRINGFVTQYFLSQNLPNYWIICQFQLHTLYYS